MGEHGLSIKGGTSGLCESSGVGGIGRYGGQGSKNSSSGEAEKALLFTHMKPNLQGTCLGVQWLRLLAPNAWASGSIPGQGARSHTPQRDSLRAATKTCHSQINK